MPSALPRRASRARLASGRSDPARAADRRQIVATDDAADDVQAPFPPGTFFATVYAAVERTVLDRFQIEATDLDQARLRAEAYVTTELRLTTPYRLFVSPAPGTESLDRFLERIRPHLLRILRSFRIPVQDAEDLVQDALLAFLVKAPEIRDPEAWVATTLFNRCGTYWRSQRAHSLKLSAARERTSDLQDLSESTIAAIELRADLEPLLRQLPDRQRQVLRLRFVLGMGPRAIAEAMGYRLSSVRKVTGRALDRLALLISEGRSAVPSRPDSLADE